MAFEFGVFHEFQRRPGQSEAKAFTTAFEQVDAAERWGLDAIWLAEIHMAPERSVCAAPLTIASAIAARTKDIKIGLGVQVLPLCQPLRLAEEAATVDHISHSGPGPANGQRLPLPAELVSRRTAHAHAPGEPGPVRHRLNLSVGAIACSRRQRRSSHPAGDALLPYFS